MIGGEESYRLANRVQQQHRLGVQVHDDVHVRPGQIGSQVQG
jgi:hypothetical protein